MTQPSAKIIADSINEQGLRLTTMEVVMHRFVLAEFNTHRVFSRNSASSRAIPYVKTRNRVAEDPAYPIHWGAEQKGMQSGEELTQPKLGVVQNVWDNLIHKAVKNSDIVHEMGLHKSLINRLLEPFMWHTVIVTATDWDNFFWQRCHPDAQPEMRAVANAMQEAYFLSTPTSLPHGAWHLPYITEGDEAGIASALYGRSHQELVDVQKQVSVARCARVSYLTHDGIRDFQEDLNLFERLKKSGHWSPFEHVATPVLGTKYQTSNHPSAEDKAITVYTDCGNFRGWKQFRKSFANENRTRFIPNLPSLAHVQMKMEALNEQTG